MLVEDLRRHLAVILQEILIGDHGENVVVHVVQEMALKQRLMPVELHSHNLVQRVPVLHLLMVLVVRRLVVLQVHQVINLVHQKTATHEVVILIGLAMDLMVDRQHHVLEQLDVSLPNNSSVLQKGK
jgi:hypothetical protein